MALKKESTKGTAVKPSHFIWFQNWELNLKQDVLVWNPIRNNRWNAQTAVKGKTSVGGPVDFIFDIVESIHFLYYLLGSISTSDIWSTPTQVYRHTFTLANDLPSFTLEQAKGDISDTSNNLQNYEVARSFWTMVDKLILSGSDGFINMKTELKAIGLFKRTLLLADVTAGSSKVLSLESVEGLTSSDTVNIYDATPQNESDAIATLTTATKSITIATLGNSYTVANKAKVELVPQTPSYWTPKQFSFAFANFQIWADLTAAAAASETNIEDWEFEYDNKLEERYGSLRSSPSVIAPKSASAKIKFKKYFTNVADRDRYLALEKAAIILTLSNNEIVSSGDTNLARYSLVIEMSDCRITSYEMPSGNDDLYGISIEAECLYDSTDGRAIRMLAVNNKAGTEYTA